MSIRRYLVLVLLSVITLVTFIAAIQGYRASMERASNLFDAELSSLAQTLQVIKPKQERNVSQLSQVIAVEQSADIAFQLFYNNQLMLRTSNAPELAMSRYIDNHFITGFSENNFKGQRWRTLVKKSKIKITPESGIQNNDNQKTVTQWVIVAQPLNRRFELAEEVILSAVAPIVIAMPFLALIIWFAIRRALRPLTQLTLELTDKKANDLSLLSTKNQTGELAPVVRTLNHLFERLAAAFERERRFASDAAHELRTPLSVLKINVHNVKNESNEQLLSMEQLVGSVDRMAHVVDQILTLNRTNPEQISIESEAINLKSLVVQVISDLYPEINKREQSISLESDDVHLMANAFSLHILIQNLISNASKYTPEHGQVLVKILAHDDSLILTVEDSGPGISEEERQRVFNRFYRVGGDQHHSAVIGCGLGLSIVKHIAMLHNAEIKLSKSESLSGLKVTVIFPNKVNSQVKKQAAPSNNGGTV
jgi:two-component system sensor histidine kinase QseC